jgi:hypothetical protein
MIGGHDPGCPGGIHPGVIGIAEALSGKAVLEAGDS